MTAKYPAPWTLLGNGFIFAYRFSGKMRGSKFFTADGAMDEKFSGFGAIMLVDYQESTAGPYQELLFTPGKFKFKNKKRHSITKIYVSTMESVVNGRENWGIPKELADFTFKKIDDKTTHVLVTKDKQIIFEAEIKEGRIKFPVTTKLFPLPLIQYLNGKIYHTKFNGKGKGNSASIQKLTINPAFFPEIDKIKPILGLGVTNFTIEFPVSEIES